MPLDPITREEFRDMAAGRLDIPCLDPTASADAARCRRGCGRMGPFGYYQSCDASCHKDRGDAA